MVGMRVLVLIESDIIYMCMHGFRMHALFFILKYRSVVFITRLYTRRI